MLRGIAAVRVFVTDLVRSVPFYRDVFGLQPVFFDGTAAMFDTGQTKLIVEPVNADDAEAMSYIGRFCAISFEVADMSAAHAALLGHDVRFDGPPERQEWGGTLAHFFDPDGNVLTLVANQPD